ncbi:bacteriocin [Paenibacillus hemerocallicola]|uniref:Bacteriocin n=1 Tax=Paenibacillus hemerocallicola TaxID=1172614 RepID=A0A5C4T1V1_9BACL|nr:bacteriocin [Paenibacillus hemerocallicola]TNJ63088.1 bacteriocin [Paenibacillus hemerocallicola]
MAEKNEKQPNEAKSVELADLSQELSEEQMQNVQGGDLKVSSKPIIIKKPIRP